jgi:hypothetical protein
MVETGLLLINVQLALEVKGDSLEASLVFTNNTPTNLYLDGMSLCREHKIDRNVFVITDEKGKKVTYTASIKNRIVGPEDFVLLKKGEQFKSVVSINDAYKVRRGEKYKIQFYTYNPDSYDPKDTTLIKMESNVVEMTF